MRKQIKIEGMSCEHCVNAVKSALEELGAENIFVNLSGGYAEAEISVSDDEIKGKIADEGYTVGIITELN